MNEIVIEAQARYLIEDRVRRTRRARAGGSRRRHHRLARQSWW
jgi:hypothetical protein